MKRAILFAVVGLLFLGAGLAAYAQPSQYVVNVPFPFFVGEHQLPAGVYYVDSKRPFDSSPMTIEILHSGNDAGIALQTAATLESKDKAPAAKLVFHQYGTAYFLTQFWGSDGRGKQLAETSRETELARKQSPTDLSIAAR